VSGAPFRPVGVVYCVREFARGRDRRRQDPMNRAVTIAAEGFPRRAFTVADVSGMLDAGIIGPEEKFELVGGEIVMTAAEGVAHERIKSALTIAVVRALPAHLTIGVEATLRFADALLLEPDIAVFPRDLFSKSSAGFARLDPADAHLIIEIAVSSLAYDKGLKARLYARHRVREFWVIDANERTTWVHTGPVGDGWSSIVECDARHVLTTAALPGFSIRIGEIE
jgi:Uma2 family endonuclease